MERLLRPVIALERGAYVQVPWRRETCRTHAVPSLVAIMSAGVLGFTIVTIIFTPLSFLPSLLALPMTSFHMSQNQSRSTSEFGVYSDGYVLRKARKYFQTLRHHNGVADDS